MGPQGSGGGGNEVDAGRGAADEARVHTRARSDAGGPAAPVTPLCRSEGGSLEGGTGALTVSKGVPAPCTWARRTLGPWGWGRSPRSVGAGVRQGLRRATDGPHPPPSTVGRGVEVNDVLGGPGVRGLCGLPALTRCPTEAPSECPRPRLPTRGDPTRARFWRRAPSHRGRGGGRRDGLGRADAAPACHPPQGPQRRGMGRTGRGPPRLHRRQSRR